MKKFIFLAVIVVAGYLAYTNFFQTSAEELLVRGLEKEFQKAVQNYIAANRQAAEPGLVVIADPEKAENQVKEVRKKLQELIPTLTEEKALARAEELEVKIQNFCQKNDIDEKISIYAAKVKLNLSEPGKHQVEILARNKRGPLVLADFPLFVATSGTNLSGQAIDILGSREQSASKVRDRLYQLINEEREKAGLKPLTRDQKLEKIAEGHCLDMVKNDFVGHVSPTTGGPLDRLQAAGVEAKSYGENVSLGYNSAEDLHRGLMESPGHRMNILNSSFTHVGIGVETKGSGPGKAFFVTELFIKKGQPENKVSEAEVFQKLNNIRKSRGQTVLEETEELKYLAQRAVDHFSQKESFKPAEVQQFLITATLEGKYKFDRLNAMIVIASSADEVVNKLSQAEINQSASGLGIRAISSGGKKGQLLAILVF